MFPNKKQTGKGMIAFKGVRYQRGNGIFSSLMKNAVFPLLRYIGVNGFAKMGEFAKEAIENPSELKSIAKRKLKEVAGKAIDDGAKRAKKFVQTGKGIPPPAIKQITMKPKAPRVNKGKRVRTSKLVQSILDE